MLGIHCWNKINSLSICSCHVDICLARVKVGLDSVKNLCTLSRPAETINKVETISKCKESCPRLGLSQDSSFRLKKPPSPEFLHHATDHNFFCSCLCRNVSESKMLASLQKDDQHHANFEHRTAQYSEQDQNTTFL
jgi:hypothetical protein